MGDLDQTRADLLEQLTDNARNLLKEEFNISGDGYDLEALLKLIATHVFKRAYGYAYNDDPSKVNPPGSLGSVMGASTLFNFVPPIDTQLVSLGLKSEFFSRLDLPAWMADVTLIDLSDAVTSIISHDTENKWMHSNFVKTYSPGITEANSYKSNLVIVYCNGSLVEGGTKAEAIIFYLCGVYYQVRS